MSRRKRPAARPSQQALTAEDFRELLSASEFRRLLQVLELPYVPSLRVNPLKAGASPLKTGADPRGMGADPRGTGADPRGTGVNPLAMGTGEKGEMQRPGQRAFDQVAQHWQRKYGWQFEPVPYCDAGFWVKAAGRLDAAGANADTAATIDVPPSQSWEHKLGHFYLQDAASMLPPEVFDFPLQPEDLVLDMAASPGGKTTHLAACLQDKNLIVANDSSASRLTALRLVLHNQGVTNAVISKMAGEDFGQRYPDTFAAVLLDAPCSMQGLRSSDSHSIRPISARELDGLALRQQRMLESAVAATKPGGQIVYSTCTLNVGEDEAVVDAVLRKFGSALQVEDISSRLAAGAAGLTKWGEQLFDEQLSRTARLWPQVYGTAGFFCARLTKLEPGGSSGRSDRVDRVKSSKLEEAQYGQALTAPQTQELASQWLDDFGLELDSLTSDYRLLLNTHQNQVWMLPQAVFRLPGLPAWARPAGFPLADITPDGYQPSHDFAARFFSHFSANRYTVEKGQVKDWLRGEPLDGATGTYRPRQIVVMADAEGLFLGLAKVVNGQFKNILPRRLLGS